MLKVFKSAHNDGEKERVAEIYYKDLKNIFFS